MYMMHSRLSLIWNIHSHMYMYTMHVLMRLKAILLYLSSHEKMGNLNDEIECPYQVLLVAMVTLHDRAGLVQHLSRLRVTMMSQQKLNGIIYIVLSEELSIVFIY